MFSERGNYTYVHLSGSTNSTMFTDCCGCAVTDDDIKCPECGANVYGADAPNAYERNRMRWKYAFKGK